MRADQEREEAVNYFETPFSLQAKEDQKRFGRSTDDPAPKEINEQAAQPAATSRSDAVVAEAAPAKAAPSEPAKAEAVAEDKRDQPAEVQSQAARQPRR